MTLTQNSFGLRRALTLLSLCFLFSTSNAWAIKPGKVTIPLQRVSLDALYATQASIGSIEVDLRVQKIKKMSEKELNEYQIEKAGKIVQYKDRLYLVDGHHMANAMKRAGHESFLAQTVEKWIDISEADFEKFMITKGYCLLTTNGDAQYAELRSIISQKVLNLKDDPFRSLAWGVRKVGGFEKSETDYAEFAWARYFDGKISAQSISKDFKQAIRDALPLAHLPQASKLPGYKPKADYTPEQVEKRLKKLED